MEKVKSEIIFGDEKVKESLDKLKNSKTEERRIDEGITKAFEELEKDAFSGIQIPKKLIPKYYEKRFGKIDNLWKYNLPNAWRLIHTIKREQVIVLSIILEWMSHKDYERRFKY